jgi:hypothetical protein
MRLFVQLYLSEFNIHIGDGSDILGALAAHHLTLYTEAVEV